MPVERASKENELRCARARRKNSGPKRPKLPRVSLRHTTADPNSVLAPSGNQLLQQGNITGCPTINPEVPCWMAWGVCRMLEDSCGGTRRQCMLPGRSRHLPKAVCTVAEASCRHMAIPCHITWFRYYTTGLPCHTAERSCLIA